jgi:hypothetical protein
LDAARHGEATRVRGFVHQGSIATNRILTSGELFTLAWAADGVRHCANDG